MFEKIDPWDLDGNFVRRIGKDRMLLTAGNRTGCNTMTLGWGGLGVLWGEPVVTVYVRPQRYTREFLELQKAFSLCFFPPEYRRALSLCGTKSGREVDKVRECGFTVEYGPRDIPCFSQAELTLFCETGYVDALEPERCLDLRGVERWYPEKDWHIMYIGKIIEVWKAKE